jgi:hypothetical protein
LRKLEARVGIEPTHKGFADLSLTTWVPRLETYILLIRAQKQRALGEKFIATWREFWSGRPGSNRRHLPWQGSTLPLSYSRSTVASISKAGIRAQGLEGKGKAKENAEKDKG